MELRAVWLDLLTLRLGISRMRTLRGHHPGRGKPGLVEGYAGSQIPAPAGRSVCLRAFGGSKRPAVRLNKKARMLVHPRRGR
jgi:hypothetical protein